MVLYAAPEVRRLKYTHRHELTDLGRGTAVRGASTSSRGLFNNSKSSYKPKSAPATSKGPAASTSNTDWIVQATSKFETVRVPPTTAY